MSRLDRIAAGSALGALRHVARMIAQERVRTRDAEDDYLDALDVCAEIVADEINRIATFIPANGSYPGEQRSPRHVHVSLPSWLWRKQ